MSRISEKLPVIAAIICWLQKLEVDCQWENEYITLQYKEKLHYVKVKAQYQVQTAESFRAKWQAT